MDRTKISVAVLKPKHSSLPFFEITSVLSVLYKITTLLALLTIVAKLMLDVF